MPSSATTLTRISGGRQPDRRAAEYPELDATGGITLGPPGIYPYPPIWAAAFAPLAGLPREPIRLGWLACLILLAVVVGVALVRPLDPRRRYWAAAGYAIFLPLLSEVRFGNLDLITLALCLLAWDRRERPIIAGLLFSVAVGLKLLPIALLVFLIAGRRWRIAAWVAGFSAMAVIITLPWIGSLWGEYVGVLWASHDGHPKPQRRSGSPEGAASAIRTAHHGHRRCSNGRLGHPT